MRKILAVILTLVFITLAVPAFADWEEGLSPAHPYTNQPEVDLDKSIGYIMFYPNAKKDNNAAGQKTLFLYLPREDVMAANNGSLIFRSSDKGEEWRVKFSDAEYIRMRSLVPSELDGLMWGSGVCFEITLPVSPRLGASYTVDLEPLCIINTSGSTGNPEIKDQWKFDSYGDYGVSQLEYRRPKNDGTYENGIGRPQAGDEIRFDLVLGGDAYMAILYVQRGAEFTMDRYTESCEIVGTVTGEDPYWGVIFLDSAGNELLHKAF